jgi:HD-GYP domain-containing protein (c-di-GMP phosphodiesterase class II)
LLHLTGAVGVMGACVGLGVSKRMSPTAHDVLSPILTRDPLAAFEIGLSPIVHRFVADLEMKDQITRDHTIRTGELALRVGERMGLRGRELRDLGLAAMLHDVGKVHTPDDILMKPSRLTAEEYEVIQGHTVDGEAMLATEPALAGAARIVRSHHERVDGGGYPDGLRGDEIPLESRIIAACDAIDAMTHDRPYRKALPFRLGFAILREHAGTQWDPDVVRAVIATMPDMPAMSRLDDVGRGLSTLGSAVVEADDATADAAVEIPDDIGELLAALDAEI